MPAGTLLQWVSQGNRNIVHWIMVEQVIAGRGSSPGRYLTSGSGARFFERRFVVIFVACYIRCYPATIGSEGPPALPGRSSCLFYIRRAGKHARTARARRCTKIVAPAH